MEFPQSLWNYLNNNRPIRKVCQFDQDRFPDCTTIFRRFRSFFPSRGTSSPSLGRTRNSGSLLDSTFLAMTALVIQVLTLYNLRHGRPAECIRVILDSL